MIKFCVSMLNNPIVQDFSKLRRVVGMKDSKRPVSCGNCGSDIVKIPKTDVWRCKSCGWFTSVIREYVLEGEE